jgi:integrase
MPIYKMEGKKDGLQKYRVRINYKDATGENRQVDRIAYGAAEAKELEYKLSTEIKKTPPEKRMTVKNLYDKYIAVKKYEIRKTSLNKSSTILENHVLPFLKNKKLNQLNLALLQEWKNYIEKKSLSFTMKKNIFSAFRAMLNFAVKFGHLASNPLLKIGNFKDAYETKKEMNYYTAKEFKIYIKQAKDIARGKGFHEWNYYVFFNIAFYTGLRKGEIHALKWSDIENNILHVKRSITQKTKKSDMETPPKNRSSFRSLQLPTPLIKILETHRKRYQPVDGFLDDWRICGGLKCLRDTTIDKRNRLYAEMAGLDRIRIHDFRHSHASLLANEGINIQEIARRLGHSQIEITWNTYSHLYPREEERAIEILDKIV